MISSKSFASHPYVLVGVIGGALLLMGAALALAIGVHRKKQRKQYECLPYSNQNQVFTYATVSPPERKLSSVSIRSNESICIYATAASPNSGNDRSIDFVVPPMLSPGSAMEDHLLTPLGDMPLGERLSFSGASGEKAALLASAAAHLFGGLNPELYREPCDSDEYDFPEGHLGRIWFGLDYDAPTERLLVKIVKCRNLPSRTLGQLNCCDPFIRIYLMPDERRYLQTKYKKKTCNPVFDETYVFQIPNRHMDERVLKLTVVDNERGKHHNVIGHALFPLKQLDWNCGENTLVTWKDLNKEVALETHDERRGDLHIGLAFHTNQERLTITIMEAKDLPDVLAGDLHVKISLQHEHRVIKSKKSSSHRVAPGVQLKFMESFVFKVKPSQMSSVSVIIKAVSDSHRDMQLGRIILGPFMFARGKALQHWTDAVTNAPKQVQEWHRFS
ncbi:synaptotagmin-15 [Galendromus occidentalis]|uniref:Synaptotagmin-15 n=1 Tax=Galendromus occidentalis TaxID=34638 RepID=A0AAJ7L4R7_9ACAR|nr:synaptotagmin-15 [Galendromus occidentalis]